MRISAIDWPGATLAQLSARCAEAERLGLDGYWVPMGSGLDSLLTVAVLGTRTGRIELGTAVVPAFARHPVVLAQEALTLQHQLGGRFTLGIGASHASAMAALGVEHRHVAARMGEFVHVARTVLARGGVTFAGDHYRAEIELTLAPAPDTPVLIGSLGPRVLELAGRLADGVITAHAGPRTLQSHVVPLVGDAARAAGRPRPRVVVSLPAALTTDPATAREQIARMNEPVDRYPAYAASLAREGVRRTAEIALVGDERALEDGLARLREAGATELMAMLVPTRPDTRQRTLEFLASVATRH